jgi:hypothetical protein
MPSARRAWKGGETESAVRMVGMTEPIRMRGNHAYRWVNSADSRLVCPPLRISYTTAVVALIGQDGRQPGSNPPSRVVAEPLIGPTVQRALRADIGRHAQWSTRAGYTSG